MSDIRPLPANAAALIHEDPWHSLNQFTNARVGIGRAGTSIPTHELLKFQLSHAQAIDAVHVALEPQNLSDQFASNVTLQPLLPAFRLHSKAADRMTYLQRPDYGRQLNQASEQQLQLFESKASGRFDLAIVVADGLSSYAINNHAEAFLNSLLPLLTLDQKPWNLAPLSIVQQGRVAIGDDVGEQLNAKAVLVLIGERPGLSSPDSLGLYLTWKPKRGTDDASRNCISNIRPQGLNYVDAAHKAHYLLTESRRLRLTGVGLKDRTETLQLEKQSNQHFCLTDNFIE